MCLHGDGQTMGPARLGPGRSRLGRTGDDGEAREDPEGLGTVQELRLTKGLREAEGLGTVE